MLQKHAPLPLPETFGRVIDRMQCPRCAAAFTVEAEALRCGGCGLAFPILDGIPQLAIQGTTETWSDSTEAETSAAYQQAYRELDKARKYNEAYRDEAAKRWSTSLEFRILRRQLGSQPRSEVLLDLPSGGGRLSGEFDKHTDLLVEADTGLGQLLYNRRHHEGDARVWMTASGFHIPFRSESVDGVVCCRLCHHLPTPEERERLVRELLRVARGFVIMTFFDYHSLKNLIRRARRPFNNLPPKMTMTVDQVSDLARESGAELVDTPALWRLSSGHRYALMVKG